MIDQSSKVTDFPAISINYDSMEKYKLSPSSLKAPQKENRVPLSGQLSIPFLPVPVPCASPPNE